jgi:hypothetical protein
MALSILDGNQSATTLSTILSSGQHITAHTVVSLGTQAITDMRGAVSGSVVSVGYLPDISGTVTANVPLSVDGYTASTGVRVIGAGHDGGIRIAGINPQDNNPENLEEGGAIPIFSVNNTALPISGTVSLGIQQSDDADANIKFIPIGYAQSDGGGQLDYWVGVKQTNPLPVYFPSTFSLPAGTNQIGVVTIGGGTVTIGAGTAQIGSVTAGIGLNSFGPSVLADNGFSLTSRGMMVVGGISTIDVGSDNEYRELKITSTGEALVRGSVTASISGTVPISISSVTVGNSVTIGSLPAISGTVTANTFAVQGTAVTTSNFTSTIASTVLANYNATREVLTIFNEGAGQLFVCAGSLCTTTAFQVRLSAGDYYEVPNHQTTITHSAVFATGGTARVTEVS